MPPGALAEADVAQCRERVANPAVPCPALPVVAPGNVPVLKEVLLPSTADLLHGGRDPSPPGTFPVLKVLLFLSPSPSPSLLPLLFLSNHASSSFLPARLRQAVCHIGTDQAETCFAVGRLMATRARTLGEGRSRRVWAGDGRAVEGCAWQIVMWSIQAVRAADDFED